MKCEIFSFWMDLLFFFHDENRRRLSQFKERCFIIQLETVLFAVFTKRIDYDQQFMCCGDIGSFGFQG